MARNVVPPRSGTLRRFFSWKGIGDTWKQAGDIASYGGTSSILWPLYGVFNASAALVYGTVTTATQLLGITAAGVYNGVKTIVEGRGKQKVAPKLAAGVIRREVLDAEVEVVMRDERGKMTKVIDLNTGVQRDITGADRANELGRDAKAGSRGGNENTSSPKGLWNRLRGSQEAEVGVTMKQANPSPSPQPTSCAQFIRRLFHGRQDDVRGQGAGR